MRLATLPIAEAVGHILRHNLPDEHGRKAFSKGHVIAAADLDRLRALGVGELRVAILDADDVHENEAARRVAAAVAGPGAVASSAHAGRANLLAAYAGPLAVDVAGLEALNGIEGIAVATLPHHTGVRERAPLATIKIIPFAVPEALLAEAEGIARAHAPLLAVLPLAVLEVGVILVGSARARRRIEGTVLPAIESRVAELGAAVLAARYVAPDERAVADEIAALYAQGAGLIIVAGETSVMDKDDITPTGIRLAGGRVEHYGAPVEPGNLLLLAYMGPGDAVPILGAPGCVRSRDVNIVDMLLPRLLAGERVRRRDIVALGHGGLLR
jgi:hypothetical protein